MKGIKEQDPEKKEENKPTSSLPEDDITSFSLWIKNELQPYVDKVVVSNKSLLGPALVISPISSAMRQMAFMKSLMEEQVKVTLFLFRLANQDHNSKTSPSNSTKTTI